MNKARRQLAERVKKSDLVVELLDARVPSASQNPMLRSIRRELPCIQLLTKSDLADPKATELWRLHLEGLGAKTDAVVTTDPKLRKRLAKLSQGMVPHRGKPGFPVRAMIVGIPNVGKSTLFNTLLGTHKAGVENRPAVTRREQQAQSDDLFIVDTPGVLWPNLEDQRAAQCLCAIGSVGENAYDTQTIARFALGVLSERYAETISDRFNVDPSEPSDELLASIGRRRGCLVRGQSVDLTKAAAIVLGELRSGKLGRITLELPSDLAREEPSAPSPEE